MIQGLSHPTEDLNQQGKLESRFTRTRETIGMNILYNNKIQT